MAKKSDIQKIWSDTPTIAKLAIYGVGAFMVYSVSKRLISKYQAKQKLLYYQTQTMPYQSTLPDGTTATQTINLASVAGEVHDSFYNNDWFGWTEDETRAVNAIKPVPKQFIPALEQTYLQLYNKDLRADLIAYLDSDEWQKISYLFN